MSKIHLITVKFQGNISAKFQNNTLLEVTKKLIHTKAFKNLHPMLLLFDTGKQLYFNKNEFNAFLNNEIDTKELIENCETEGLWRNTTTINFKNKLDVDPGELWTKKGEQLFLVNDDWNIITTFNKQKFKLDIFN